MGDYDLTPRSNQNYLTLIQIHFKETKLSQHQSTDNHFSLPWVDLEFQLLLQTNLLEMPTHALKNDKNQ